MTILTAQVAKDTEKLIRQLSLISFLMAQGRPVSALEIKREVEGYSDMNDDAFARRFYADRAELESLGIDLQVEKPGEGFFEAELYSLPPENFYLPAIKFSEQELTALQSALGLLTRHGFAYAEPLRLALQQVAWGQPNPIGEGGRLPIEMAISAAPSTRDISQRLAKIETAISRRKTIEFTYYTMERDETEDRVVDPYNLVFRNGEFYVVGHSHERDATRVFRLSRIQGKVGYASKAEHDFNPPDDYDRRDWARKADWQLGEAQGTAKVFLRDRVAWLAERDYGEYGTFRPATKADGAPGKGVVFETEFAMPRLLVAWVLGWRQNAELLEPADLREEVQRRLSLLRERHLNGFEPAKTLDHPMAEPEGRRRTNGRGDSPIRPERFARLVTLAGILVEAAQNAERLRVDDLTQRLKLSREELREDIDVLNVVNFGGGTYVLYAEVQGDEIEVDSEPYGDSFARPARLLPLEAKALVAAMDLIGVQMIPGLESARRKVVKALGHDPTDEGLEIAQTGEGGTEAAHLINRAIEERRVLRLNYYKPNEDEFTKRTIEPYVLQNGKEGWYVASYDLKQNEVRHFRLDRIKDVELTDERFEVREEIMPLLGLQSWMRGEMETQGEEVARVWVSPEEARRQREERTVLEELADGSVVVALPYKSTSYLVSAILDGAGEYVVLEPDDARAAVARELK